MEHQPAGPGGPGRSYYVPSERRPTYDGAFGRVLGIALTNSLLGILTLGFYRFWGKTRLRRYLWSRVAFDGDRLEYTGRGMELFVGFLVAILILIPLFLALGLMDLLLAGTPFGEAISALVYLVVLVTLIHAAIYRARRYRLTRTLWRGIRGGQTGSALAYGLQAFGWAIVTGLTFGLALPVMRTRLQAFRMENTWFGDLSFTFGARAGALFKRWLAAWILMIPTLGLSYIWYRVVEFRYFASCTNFGGLMFESDLRTGRVMWIGLRYFLALFLVLGLFGLLLVPLAPELAGMLEAAQQGEEAAAGALSGRIVVVLIALLVGAGMVVGALQAALVLHPLLGAVCASLTIVGDEDFAAIRQSRRAVPGRGEGLADALDVGSF